MNKEFFTKLIEDTKIEVNKKMTLEYDYEGKYLKINLVDGSISVKEIGHDYSTVANIKDFNSEALFISFLMNQEYYPARFTDDILFNINILLSKHITNFKAIVPDEYSYVTLTPNTKDCAILFDYLEQYLRFTKNRHCNVCNYLSKESILKNCKDIDYNEFLQYVVSYYVLYSKISENCKIFLNRSVKD